MGFKTKIQRIDRKKSEQWYVNFPAALAQAMEFQKGEVVEWLVDSRADLILRRPDVPASPIQIKKKRQQNNG
jgi:hypothetical protein